MTPPCKRFPDRCQSVVPAAYGSSRCQAMFAEQQHAIRFEHAVHLAQCADGVGNRAESEGCQHRVETFVFSRNAFGRQRQQLNIDARLARPFARQSMHLRRWIEALQRFKFFKIVDRKIEASTNAQSEGSPPE